MPSPTPHNSRKSHEISSDQQRSFTPLIVLGLLAVGLLLRLVHLGESLWYDEIAAWLDYGSQGPGAIISTYYDPANHIFHTLLTHFSMQLAGSLGDEVALRLPALMASLLGIAAMVGLGRAARNTTLGLLCAGAFAFMPVCVLEANDARGYSLMMLSAATSTWMLLRAKTNPAWWCRVLYVIALALGVWAHMMTVWIAVGHGAWLAWKLRDAPQRGWALRSIIALFVAAIVTLALYAPVLDDIWAIRSEFGASDGDEPSVVGNEGLHTLMQLGGAWFWWTSLAGGALFIIGLIRGVRDRATRDAVMLSLLGLPFMVLAMWLAGSWLYARFALFAMPGAALCFALAVHALWRRRRALAVCLILLTAGSWVMDVAIRPPRQPLRDAADYVYAQRNERDRLLVIGLVHDVMQAYIADLPHATCLHLGEEIDRCLAQAEAQWIIMLYPDRVDTATRERLDTKGYDVVRRFDGWLDWGHGDVEVWKKRGTSQ
jgi:hypothetical protein